MAIEQAPAQPISRDFIPENSTPYHVKDGDSFVSIARENNMDVWDLIYANFKTRKPAEVNWYLREYVGCKLQTKNERSWRFSSDAYPGVIHIPNGYCEDYSTYVCESEEDVPPPPKAPNYKRVAFWLEITQATLGVAKLGRGYLVASPSWNREWWWWDLGLMKGFGAGIPDPRFVGEFKTQHSYLHVDPMEFDMKKQFARRHYAMNFYLSTVKFRISSVFSSKPDSEFPPIKDSQGIEGRNVMLDLTLINEQDAELGLTATNGVLGGTRTKDAPHEPPIECGKRGCFILA